MYKSQLESSKRYYYKNKEKQYILNEKWRENNPDKFEIAKKKSKENRLKKEMFQTIINRILNRKHLTRKQEILIGMNSNEFIYYIESNFNENINWTTYNDKWKLVVINNDYINMKIK